MEKMLIRGVARDNAVARIAIIGVEDAPGIAFKVFSVLAKSDINVDMILQSIGHNGTKDIVFTVTKNNMSRAIEIIEELKGQLHYQELNCRDNLSKVSIVGAGMVHNAGVAAQMFEALFAANINIHMISTSEIKISVLINSDNAERAVQVIHDQFVK